MILSGGNSVRRYYVQGGFCPCLDRVLNGRMSARQRTWERHGASRRRWWSRRRSVWSSIGVSTGQLCWLPAWCLVVMASLGRVVEILSRRWINVVSVHATQRYVLCYFTVAAFCIGYKSFCYTNKASANKLLFTHNNRNNESCSS